MKDIENETISRSIDELVEKLHAMNTDPYFQEAIIRFAVREFSWAMLHKFDGQYALAEQLTLMGSLVDEFRPDADSEED